MSQGAWEANFHRGQAVLWLAFHATELLLKGCIGSIAPQSVENTHSLEDLMDIFSKHFPSIPFDLPFDVVDLTGDPDGNMFGSKMYRILHEQLRYPTNRTGVPWDKDGVRGFDPLLFSVTLQRLRGDIERISAAVFRE